MKKYAYKGEVVTPMCNVDTGMYIRESDRAVLCLHPSEVKEVVESKRYSYGDILYHETDSFNWVFIFTDICDGVYEGLSCVCVDDDDYYDEYSNIPTPDIRIATPAEQQLLFSALAKEGKYWDNAAKEVKEFERVPESVGIYRCKEDFGIDGDGLYIAFNDGKQLLWTNTKYNTYQVSPMHEGYQRVECRLKPVTIDDICVGDTIVVYDYNILNNYTKVCKDMIVYALEGGILFTITEFDDNVELFKLIPVR